jgi:hypothetical protein
MAGTDVVVHAKQVARIVFVLYRNQTIIIATLSFGHGLSSLWLWMVTM